MDNDDMKCFALIGIMIILGILSFILPIVICVEKGEQRDFELEKMKLQMQIYGEPVNLTNEVERKD